MKITMNIPDHLVCAVASILECGLSIDDEKYIMRTENITVNEFITAIRIVTDLPDMMRNKLK